MTLCPTCSGTGHLPDELPGIVFRRLRDDPNTIVYRGHKSGLYFLSGPPKPMGPFTREAVMRAVRSGRLVEKWPSDQRIGTDALTVPSQ